LGNLSSKLARNFRFRKQIKIESMTCIIQSAGLLADTNRSCTCNQDLASNASALDKASAGGTVNPTAKVVGFAVGVGTDPHLKKRAGSSDVNQ
jgi:hypothetical protein